LLLQVTAQHLPAQLHVLCLWQIHPTHSSFQLLQVLMAVQLLHL
jgi:hypothetical protein